MAGKPNIIFVMPDQLRADFLSCYDASFIDTPNIDALADHGVIYGNAYSAHPVCVPARVSLMTGMNAIKTGVLDNGAFLRPDYRDCGLATWPEILSENGYYTVGIGKMHFFPWEIALGFQHRIIAEDKVWIHIRDDYDAFLRAHGYEKNMGHERADYQENYGAFLTDLPWEYSVDHFVGQEATRWIEGYQGDEPFAMMVGFPGPHPPYDPAPEFAREFDDADIPAPVPEVAEDMHVFRGKRPKSKKRLWWRSQKEGDPDQETYMLHRRYYAALVKQIDYEMGCILDALRERGMLDNTIILFSSDHGDYLGDHDLSGKNSFFEAATHVPLLVRLPKAEGTTVCHDLVTLTDITATMLHFSGCVVPQQMEGDSIPLPALGIDVERPRDRVVGALTRSWMYLDGEWKLCKYASGGALLYNLRQDPTEQHNLARDGRYQEVFHDLDDRLTSEIMASIAMAHYEKRVYARVPYPSTSTEVGERGWRRRYPQRVGDVLAKLRSERG
mgnify:CR=1 FL=1